MQTLLDGQLAFVARIQAQFQDHAHAGLSQPLPHKRWLLFRQLAILARFKEATEHDLPVPKSPSRSKIAALDTPKPAQQ